MEPPKTGWRTLPQLNALLDSDILLDFLVLCNRYDLPIVEFKMARRQGATREHVLCHL